VNETLLLRDRYLKDARFHILVDHLCVWLREPNNTPMELQEALSLAIYISMTEKERALQKKETNK